MKLDKIRFANLVQYISNQIGFVYPDVVNGLDDIIEFDVPTPTELPAPTSIFEKASETDVNKLLYAFAAGDRKIEAIKAYRNLTGAGLKESKDAIERFTPPKYDDQLTAKDYQFQLLDRVYTANSKDPDADAHVLDGFSDRDLKAVYDYISSFTTYK